MYVCSEVIAAIVCTSVRVCVTDLSRSKAVAPFLTRPRKDVLNTADLDRQCMCVALSWMIRVVTLRLSLSRFPFNYVC